MTTEQILDGNVLIAEFMTGVSKNAKVFFSLNSSANDLKYHKSWDWLMPVIGKISNGCEEPEELDGLKYALLTNNINESWRFVVEFIKHYITSKQ